MVLKYKIMEKICSKCKQSKKLNEFNKNKSGKHGVHHYCKDCNSIQKKSSYNYVKSRNRGIKNRYNLTFEEVENLYTIQNKKCKICKTEHSSIYSHGGLYIDHCHTTGKVRGLLCSKCNMLLGNCNDDVSILTSAIDYLSN